jgi:hypothetical protein
LGHTLQRTKCLLQVNKKLTEIGQIFDRRKLEHADSRRPLARRREKVNHSADHHEKQEHGQVVPHDIANVARQGKRRDDSTGASLQCSALAGLAARGSCAAAIRRQ